MTKIYRKVKNIKAEQFDGSDEMIDKYTVTPPMPLDPDYTINTLEGDMVLGVGDWIATGSNDEHWAIAEDVFKKTYAELSVIPRYVAEYIEHMKSIHCDIWDAMHYLLRPDNVDEYMTDTPETFARAWLDGYMIEKQD